MPNHLRKRHHRDPAQLAKLMIDIASGEVDDPAPSAIVHAVPEFIWGMAVTIKWSA
jgi:hypothetical protein